MRLRAEDPTIAELLKPLGYAIGQFGKNHLGEKDGIPTLLSPVRKTSRGSVN